MDITLTIFLGILTSLIASAIFASAHHDRVRRFLSDSRANLFRYFQTRIPIRNAALIQPAIQARKKLIQRLQADQSEDGLHRGQFGRSTDPENERRFITGAEQISTKPRIYLTLWPTTILSSRHLLPKNVSLAIEGICSLFSENRVRVFQAAPAQSPPHTEASLISYRHSIGAALLLHSAQGWDSTVRSVVDAMIDPRNHWQNDDGGWAQCDRDHTESDIWCSAYAVQLIAKALKESRLNEMSAFSPTQLIDSTLSYFVNRWRVDQWAVGKSSSEENSVLILIEIAPLLYSLKSGFLQEILLHMKSWLSPSGQLSEAYISKCPGNSYSALHARMAYAFFRSEEDTSTWLPLFKAAVEKPDDKFNSSDMAFIVDLSFVIDVAR